MTPEKYEWLTAKIEEYNYKAACAKQDQEHKQRKLEIKEKGSYKNPFLPLIPFFITY